MPHAATQTQYYYGNQYNDSNNDAPGQNLGQKKILENNSHAYEQFQSFGDEMNNPQSQKGPTMSTSHLGSHLGVARPREKIEGPLFKQEYSQGSVEHSGKSILPYIRESDGNSQAELDKALQVEKPKTTESNRKNKNQASAGQGGNVNSKTQENQSVQTQGLIYHPASDPNQTEKGNSAMNSNKNTARIDESIQKRKSIKQSPRDIKNRDPALDQPKHQQLSHNPNSRNGQGNNMLEGPYPNQFPQPIGTPNSNFGLPPGFLQSQSNPFGGFKQGMPVAYPGTFTSSHQSQSATLSKDEKEKLEKAHQFTEEIGSKLATVPSEMLDLRSRPSIKSDTITSLLQKVSIIQSDMNFKVDKDAYQLDLEDKLDRTEFHNRMAENNNLHDTIVKVDYNNKTLSRKVREVEEALEKSCRKLKKHSEARSEQLDMRIVTLIDQISCLEQEIKTKPSLDEYRMKNGNNIQQEIDRIMGIVNEMYTILGKIRGDQVSALASNTLCLSCGRGDVNFMPPVEVAQGANGQYYKTDLVKKSPSNNKGNDFDVGRET